MISQQHQQRASGSDNTVNMHDALGRGEVTIEKNRRHYDIERVMPMVVGMVDDGGRAGAR